MHNSSTQRGLRDWQEVLGLLAVPCVPAILVLAVTSEAARLSAVATFANVAGGVLLLLATVMGYLTWRTTPDPRSGWVVAVLALVTSKVLADAGSSTSPELIASADFRATSITVGALTAALGVAMAWKGLRHRNASMPDPILLGVTLGMVLMLVRLGLTVISLGPPPPAVVTTLAVLSVAGYAGIGALVSVNPQLPHWAQWRLVATMLLVGAGPLAYLVHEGQAAVDLAVACTRAAAGALWLSASWIMLRESLEVQRARASSLEGAMLEIEETARGTRERLHEVRSTLAGLASASELLTDENLPADVRHRLEKVIRDELARLARLVANAPGRAGLVDLDVTLDTVTQLHRARGHDIQVDVQGGTQVIGEADAVAAALNILVDNAATHAGNGTGRISLACRSADGHVEISVIDDGPGVPEHLRHRMFEWGVRSEGSPGQGIGLTMARRLVDELGGTLTLAPPRELGTEFVIRLPSPQATEEFA